MKLFHTTPHNRRPIYLIFIFLLLTTGLFAQMSDQQVLEELMKYRDSGKSPEQVALEMSQKGVTPAQLKRLRDQYMNQEGTAPSLQPEKQPQGDVLRSEAELVENPQPLKDAVSTEETIYGQNLFSSKNLTFAPSMNMPTPANYILGPGDEILIDVWGNSELNLRFTITPDGYITVPGLGRIQLSGLNVEQAKGRIRTQFSTIYSDLDSPEPRTFLAISVGNVRTIKVNVMGEVNTPGTYTVSSFSSAFHALYVAGGTTKIGSLRNIRIFRSGRERVAIDLYEYLMKGNNMEDITLNEGDIVMVEPYGSLVQITGEVKRPMWYEMKPEETLQDLINYSGGFGGNAYKGTLSLLRQGSEEMEAHTLSEVEYAHFQLKDGDRVEIGNILDQYANMIEITGSVYRPGKYAIGDRIKTVGDLIDVAQGTTGDAYLKRALLYRENEDLTRTMQSFDVGALLNHQIADIPLKKNDILHISSVLSLDEDFTVFIGGEVRKSGNYPYADNMQLEDIILQAGGLTEAASTARLDVYRRIKDPSGTTTRKQSSEMFSFTLADGEIVSSDPDFRLEPYDQIIIRRSPGYEVQQNVTIQGEVLFEGQYAKLSKDERISSLIKRAGGLTPYAYIHGARLTRRLTAEEQKQTMEAHRVKTQTDKADTDSLFQKRFGDDNFTVRNVGINLKKALHNPGGPEDIIIHQGDVLNIPQHNELVKISGGVMYPNMVTYQKNKKLEYYVNQAGGYSRLAMKNKPFVVYMNGQVSTGRWARIEPGCEIVVPERPEREPLNMQGLLGIGTSIASIALLISSLIK